MTSNHLSYILKILKRASSFTPWNRSPSTVNSPMNLWQSTSVYRQPGSRPDSGLPRRRPAAAAAAGVWPAAVPPAPRVTPPPPGHRRRHDPPGRGAAADHLRQTRRRWDMTSSVPCTWANQHGGLKGINSIGQTNGSFVHESKLTSVSLGTFIRPKA